MEYVRSKVPAKDRDRATVVRLDKRQASWHISPSDGPHFRLISRVIQETMGGPQASIMSDAAVIDFTLSVAFHLLNHCFSTLCSRPSLIMCISCRESSWRRTSSWVSQARPFLRFCLLFG